MVLQTKALKVAAKAGNFSTKLQRLMGNAPDVYQIMQRNNSQIPLTVTRIDPLTLAIRRKMRLRKRNPSTKPGKE